MVICDIGNVHIYIKKKKSNAVRSFVTYEIRRLQFEISCVFFFFLFFSFFWLVLYNFFLFLFFLEVINWYMGNKYELY